jgi:hypothetical protein
MSRRLDKTGRFPARETADLGLSQQHQAYWRLSVGPQNGIELPRADGRTTSARPIPRAGPGVSADLVEDGSQQFCDPSGGVSPTR